MVVSDELVEPTLTQKNKNKKTQNKDEERERNRDGMAAADLESAFYRYYSKLQPVIQALNQQRDALRNFSTR